jgi:hypothetical protein
VLIPKTNCPKCLTRFTSQTGFAVGQVIRCPKCGIDFAVVGPVAQKPPARAKPAANKPVRTALDNDDRPVPSRTAPIWYVLLGVLLASMGFAGYLLYEKRSKQSTETANAGSQPAPSIASAPETPAPAETVPPPRPKAEPPTVASPPPIQKPPKSVPAAEIAALVKEFAVPPIKPDNTEASIASFPFREDALKDYKADVSLDDILKNKEKYRFRVAVIDAFTEVRTVWKVGGTGGLKMRESFPAPVTAGLKNQIKAEQNTWAIGIAKFDLLNQRLDGLVKERDTQPPRWQAHFDYARAVVKTRLAYMNEFDLMLGNVMTETLPELDAKLNHDAYKLVSTETAKMKSKKDVKQLATDAAELFDKLMAERKDTPWALQAKRDSTVALGLMWLPYSRKGPTMR